MAASGISEEVTDVDNILDELILRGRLNGGAVAIGW